VVRRVRDRHGPAPTSTGAFPVPIYDETIVAYQDLRVVLAHPPPRAGMLDRAIIIDGYTAGSWKRTLRRRQVTVMATLFRPLTIAETEALDTAVERLGRSLELLTALETSVNA